MQLLKRFTAALLVLVALFSCVPGFPTPARAAQTEPISTEAAVSPTENSVSSETLPESTTETFLQETVPESTQESTVSTENSTIPSEEPSQSTTPSTSSEVPQNTASPTEPKTVTQLQGDLESFDASIHVTLPDSSKVPADAKLLISDFAIADEELTPYMEAVGIENVLSYCAFRMHIENTDIPQTDCIQTKITFHAPVMWALSGDFVYVVVRTPDGTLEVLPCNSTVDESFILLDVQFDSTFLVDGTQFTILTTDMPSTEVIHSVSGTFAVQGFKNISVGKASRLHDITYHYVDSLNNPGYCLEPHKSFGYASSGGASSSTVTVSSWGSKNGDSVWKALSENKRKAIALISMLALNPTTYNTSAGTTGANLLTPNNANQCMFAAGQIMVWEVVGGWRSFPSPNTCSDSRVIDNFDRGGVRAAYDQLNQKITNWMNITSGSRVSVEDSSYKVSWVTSSDQTVLTVANMVYETVTPPTGNIQIEKEVSGSGSVADWRFELYSSYSSAMNASSNYIDSAYSNSSGIATFYDIPSGGYYVREAPASRQYRKTDLTGWSLSSTIFYADLSGGTVWAGTATNTAPQKSQITVQKAVTSDSTSGKLNGWVFQVSTSASFSPIAATLTTDANGTAKTGYTLNAGTYYVREAPLEDQTRTDKDHFILDSTVSSVVLGYGESKLAISNSVTNTTATNVEKGTLRVRKGVTNTDASAANLSGWVFHIYSGADKVASVTTGNDGYATSEPLTPGVYTVREAPASEQTRSDLANWTLDRTESSVTVLAGKSVDAVASNGYTAVNSFGQKLQIQKQSRCDAGIAAALSGNSMYSLEGAQYQLIIDGTVVEVLTTDASGLAQSETSLDAGTTGTLVEIKAPAGHLLNPDPIAFTVPDTGACIVTVFDDPTFDPAILPFQKIDKLTGTPQGNATFEGAVFRWDYYDNTDWSGSPAKTWYFQTDAAGLHLYHTDYLADGYTSDPLYLAESGAHLFPLGSLTITEITAPVGYAAMPELKATITQKTDGGAADFDWSEDSLRLLTQQDGKFQAVEEQDTATFGSLEIQKTTAVPQNEIPAGVTFAGCEFAVYNRSSGTVKIGDHASAAPNDICYVLTADEAGHAKTANIFPVGKYEVVESKGNDFYQRNETWSHVFEITGTESAAPNAYASCENKLIASGTIHLQKLTTEQKPLPGAKFLLEWSEDGITWKPVTRSSVIAKGGCTSPDLDADGCLVIGAEGTASFTGLMVNLQYRLTEVEVPNGYQLLKDHIIVETLTAENNFTAGYRVINNDVFELPKTGGVGFMKMPLAIVVCFCSLGTLLYFLKKRG